MTRTILPFAVALLLMSCGTGPYMGKDLYGADEFVLDSYKIREGKLSILEMEGVSCGEFDEALLEEYEDRIGEDDVLDIILYNPKRKDVASAIHTIGAAGGYRVIKGEICLPDSPPMRVEGLTLEEARLKIQAYYNRQIADTQVFVKYQERIVRKVELMGLTGTSSIPVNGKLRLFDLLSMARIPVDANLFKSYVLRGGHPLPIDMTRLIKNGDMSQNIVMRGGDKVYIAEASASTLMVMGEVGRDRTIALPN